VYHLGKTLCSAGLLTQPFRFEFPIIGYDAKEIICFELGFVSAYEANTWASLLTAVFISLSCCIKGRYVEVEVGFITALELFGLKCGENIQVTGHKVISKKRY
jgi:hypothetical protein